MNKPTIVGLLVAFAVTSFATAADASCQHNVTYYGPGGSVIAHPKIMNIYWDWGWGSYWTTTGASNVSTNDNAWSFVASTPLLYQRIAEYGVGQGSWAGSYMHTSGPSGALTNSAIETMLAQDFQYGRLSFDPSTIYVIYFSPDVSSSDDVASHSWAHHRFFPYSGQQAIYAVVESDSLSKMQEHASHEISEAATDPQATGWSDRSMTEGEIGDLCTGLDSQIHGATIQMEWSQRQCRCVGNPDVLNDDFDGDGYSDYAAWKPASGVWATITNLVPYYYQPFQWGISGDVPVIADYDGDGRADYAVWRPSEGKWYIQYSTGGSLYGSQWGLNGDIPVPADYDGDAKADLAVWRPSEGKWYIRYSSGGSLYGSLWGLNGDVPVPGDYDGDGKADLAVWRASSYPAAWYIIPSRTGSAYTVWWGLDGDTPVPGDYDGDGLEDQAVWRSSTATFYMLHSGDGTQTTQQVGASGDIPVSRKWSSTSVTSPETFRPSAASWQGARTAVFAGSGWAWDQTGDIPAEKLTH